MLVIPVLATANAGRVNESLQRIESAISAADNLEHVIQNLNDVTDRLAEVAETSRLRKEQEAADEAERVRQEEEAA